MSENKWLNEMPNQVEYTPGRKNLMLHSPTKITQNGHQPSMNNKIKPTYDSHIYS